MKKKITGRQLWKDYSGWLFVLPLVFGIAIFTVVPMVTSLYYSLHDYLLIKGEPVNFGFQNYIRPFTEDWNIFGNSLWVTFSYALVSIPLNFILSYGLALLLNMNVRGIGIFRTLYYTPVIIPAVVAGLLWSDMTDVNLGVFNMILEGVGLPKYSFYSTNETVFPTLLFMSLFGVGGSMVLWLAQLKNIPESMFEAAKIEGAGAVRRVLTITLPMSTPMIFYNLVLGVINSLQIFSSVYVLLTPANGEALNFYVVNVYNTAFQHWDMGYASALSWILFIIIAILTAVIFKTSRWVFFGEDIS